MSAALQIQDYSDIHYDPFTAAAVFGGEGHIGDIYPELARLRRIAPVHQLDVREHFKVVPDLTTRHLRHFVALSYDVVTQILTDPARFSNHIYNHNMGIYFGRSITTMDPPEHTRYRRIFQKAFLPNTINDWGTTLVPRVINRLIDDFADRSHAELVSEFTLHFPFHFIHELLALPEEDRKTFHKLAFGQITIIFDPEHGYEALNKLKDYLTELVRHRRHHPVSENDFIHTIANVEVDGERLPDDVVISFFRQLMNAGGDTSYHGFSSVMAGLLTHPEQLDAVRKDRTLVRPAIEEGLRWNCPVMFIFRTPTQTTTIGGATIEPGDEIAVCLGSANRDESVYERPDEFDIFRKVQRHNAFGFGSHICIGQHLARMEMSIALNALLDRFPRLRLDSNAPAPTIHGLGLRGPHSLHVRFD